MKRKAPAKILVPQVVDPAENELYASIRAIITEARATVYIAANSALVIAYWNIGRLIVEQQGSGLRAKYGDGLIKAISLKLTAEFGAGFTTTNLRYMRLVYQAFPICHTLCDKLSWSHDRLLATVEELQRELQKERTAVEEALRLHGQTTLNLPIRKKGAK